MAILSKAKQLAKRMQQLAVDRHVLSRMHEMLREYLERTGKFTAEERTIWERDMMVPTLAREGIDVRPKIYVPVPPKPVLISLPTPQLVSGPAPRLVEPKAITVEPTIVNPTSFLGP